MWQIVLLFGGLPALVLSQVPQQRGAWYTGGAHQPQNYRSQQRAQPWYTVNARGATQVGEIGNGAGVGMPVGPQRPQVIVIRNNNYKPEEPRRPAPPDNYFPGSGAQSGTQEPPSASPAPYRTVVMIDNTPHILVPMDGSDEEPEEKLEKSETIVHRNLHHNVNSVRPGSVAVENARPDVQQPVFTGYPTSRPTFTARPPPPQPQQQQYTSRLPLVNTATILPPVTFTRPPPPVATAGPTRRPNIETRSYIVPPTVTEQPRKPPVAGPVKPVKSKSLAPISEENFCDIAAHSDNDLNARGLFRTTQFIGSQCSNQYFQCAQGLTYIFHCANNTVFDLELSTCNYKTATRDCPEYDHVAHCSVKEECEQAGQFACCADVRCIDMEKRCDGVPHCSDGDDEGNCEDVRCSRTEFLCRQSSRCIEAAKRCNGVPDDCGDGSNDDELACGGCPPDLFTCTQSRRPAVHIGRTDGGPVCVDWQRRCDGTNDCPNGEDEANCESGTAMKYLLCENQLQSVSRDKWCDGKEDCLDGSDEFYC